MGLILFALFVAIPLIEIMLFIQIGGLIGTGWTILIVIFTAFLGSFLLRQQGLQVLGEAQTRFSEAQLPVDSLIHGFFLVVAGAFLLTPGFLTDGIGFLLFVPPIRLAIGRAIWKFVAARAKVVTVSSHQEHYYSSEPGSSGPGRNPMNDGDIIDGEAEDVSEEEQAPNEDSPWRHG